jgi:F-type H+-transporting ATPase subunit b
MSKRGKLFVLFAIVLASAWPLAAWAVQHGGARVTATHTPDAEGGDARGEEPPGEKHAWPPKPINWTDASNKDQPPLVASAVNLIVLLLIYYFAGRKGVANALTARKKAIASEIEDAQRMKRAAQERAKHYQQKLENLEEELATTRAALVEAGKGERDRIVKEAEEKAARMHKDAGFLVEQEKRQIQQDLLRETVERALSAAEELLKKRITPADQERLAEEYLAEIGGGASASRPSIAAVRLEGGAS